MASCVLVLRNTFRLHDNPALHYALQDARCKTIFIPIDSARVLAPHQCIPTIQGDVITHTLPSLLKGVPYHVQVSAFNGVGDVYGKSMYSTPALAEPSSTPEAPV